MISNNSSVILLITKTLHIPIYSDRIYFFLYQTSKLKFQGLEVRIFSFKGSPHLAFESRINMVLLLLKFTQVFKKLTMLNNGSFHTCLPS